MIPKDSDLSNNLPKPPKAPPLSIKPVEDTGSRIPDYLQEEYSPQSKKEYTRYSIGNDSEAKIDVPRSYQTSIAQPFFKSATPSALPVSYEEYEDRVEGNIVNLNLASKSNIVKAERPNSGYKYPETYVSYQATGNYIREEVQEPTRTYLQSPQKKTVYAQNSVPSYASEISTRKPNTYTIKESSMIPSLVKTIPTNNTSVVNDRSYQNSIPSTIQDKFQKSYISVPSQVAYQSNSSLNPRVVNSPNVYSSQMQQSVIKTSYIPQNEQPKYSSNQTMVTSVIPNYSMNPSSNEKHENQLCTELNRKLDGITVTNDNLSNEILDLRNILEKEQQKSREIEENMIAENEHFVIKRDDLLNKLNQMRKEKEELDKNISNENTKQEKIKSELERTMRDNENLRNELKRLGSLTSEKILDLENNINSVNRMKDFEEESFVMEKDKIASTSDFVREQIKLHFNERSSKQQEIFTKTQQEKDKAEKELKAIREELKNFNSAADIKINNEMGIVFREEEERHQREMRDIENKIRLEDEEIDRINRRLQDLLGKLKSFEKESKGKIVTKKNDNLKLKEEFGSLESAFNKSIVQINSENKELEKKRELLDSKFAELEELKEKKAATESRYNDEIDNINMGHEEGVKELEQAIKHFQDEEQRLTDEIQQEKDKMVEIQKNHNAIIDQLRNNVNSSVQNQFTRFSGVKKTTYE